MPHDAATWRAIIDEMQRAERKLPHGEMWAVETMHWLADFLLHLRRSLTEEQRAMLIAIGGMIAREANRETMAALEADLALRRAGSS